MGMMDTDALDRLEDLMNRAWRAPGAETVDGWVLRSAGSVTQRANSVWPAAVPADLDAALRSVAAWYAAKRQPVIFQLTARAGNKALGELLDRRGYSRASETLIMTARGASGDAVSADAVSAGRAADAEITLADVPSPEWLDLWWRVDGRGGAAERHIALSIVTRTPSLYATARDGHGAIVGTGRLTVLDGWGGIYCMAVHPEFRRQGVATAILYALRGAGQEAGATDFWLMATEANTGGRALYERAGFAESARYHYRQAPLHRAPNAC